MNLNKISWTLSISLLTLIQSMAWGAVLPGSVLPEQVGRALVGEEPTAQAPAPSVVAPPEEKKTPGGEAAKKIKFQLNGIELIGNRMFCDYQLRPLYQKKLHTTITVADLFTIVQDITNYYRNNGYIITRAILPPQHVKGGVVKVRIIEGYLSKVDVTGKPRGAKCLVKAFGEKIVECRPLQIKRMERYLLLANEIPGTDVRAVLSPSKTETGAADLTLTTINHPVMTYLSYDNYGTRYIGPQQITANLGVTSALYSGDQGQITLTKTPKGGELTFIDANYGLGLNAEGVRSLMGVTRTQTHPLFVLTPVDIDGVTQNYYYGLNFPWTRTRTESLSFQLGFNYMDTFVTALDFPLYTDHLRPIGAGLTYNFSDKYAGANLIFAEIRQGLPIFGYTSDTNPATARTSRPGGHADFTKIDFYMSRLQALVGPLSLYGLLKGQWAAQALLAAEQFTFGGPQIGRGYDVAEIIGDSGVEGTIELRYDWGLNKWFLQTLQPYIFYDFGIIWSKKTTPNILVRQSGTSTGLGTRFYFTKYVSGNLLWTQTLTKPVAAESLIGQGRRPRTWFSIVAAFS